MSAPSGKMRNKNKKSLYLQWTYNLTIIDSNILPQCIEAKFAKVDMTVAVLSLSSLNYLIP